MSIRLQLLQTGGLRATCLQVRALQSDAAAAGKLGGGDEGQCGHRQIQLQLLQQGAGPEAQHPRGAHLPPVQKEQQGAFFSFATDSASSNVDTPLHGLDNDGTFCAIGAAEKIVETWMNEPCLMP